MGAEVLINANDSEDPVTAVRDLTRGSGADLALDASGSPIARRQAVQCVRTWGKVCLVGEGGEITLDVSNDLIRKQVTVLGSWTFSMSWQADCARYIAERKIALDKLFTDRWRLDQAEEAYRVFDKQTSGKGVFVS